MESKGGRMERIKYDSKNIAIIDIDDVRPNNWNPKDKQTEEYEIIKRGIKLKGLRLPIIVRENKGYEIIDGEQRWRICKELGYKKIIIYNEGQVSDKEARELTIWYEQHVPFNEVNLAKLITDMNTDYGNLEVPFTDEAIKDMEKLTKFDWDAFKATKTPDTNNELKTLSVTMTSEQYDIIQRAMNNIKEKAKPTEISDGRALELLAGDYLGGN